MSSIKSLKRDARLNVQRIINSDSAKLRQCRELDVVNQRGTTAP